MNCITELEQRERLIITLVLGATATLAITALVVGILKSTNHLSFSSNGLAHQYAKQLTVTTTLSADLQQFEHLRNQMEAAWVQCGSHVPISHLEIIKNAAQKMLDLSPGVRQQSLLQQIISLIDGLHDPLSKFYHDPDVIYWNLQEPIAELFGFFKTSGL